MFSIEKIIQNLQKQNHLTDYSYITIVTFIFLLISASYKFFRYWALDLYEKRLCGFDVVCKLANYTKENNPKIAVLEQYMLKSGETRYLNFMIDTVILDTLLFLLSFIVLYGLYIFKTGYTRKNFERHCRIIRSNEGERFLANLHKFMSGFGVFVWAVIFLVLFVIFFYETSPEQTPARFNSLLSNIYKNPFVGLFDTLKIAVTIPMMGIFLQSVVVFRAIRDA